MQNHFNDITDLDTGGTTAQDDKTPLRMYEQKKLYAPACSC